jgi:hypothetical protein
MTRPAGVQAGRLSLISRWLAEWLCGPERSWTEEEAYLAGYQAKPGTENPFSGLRERRAWRQGRDNARG